MEVKETPLSEIAKITMGQSPNSTTYNTVGKGVPLLNGATDFRTKISTSKWTTDPKRMACPGSYIFGVRATIGLTKLIRKNYAIGRGTGTAKVLNPKYQEFLYFCLQQLFDYYSKVGSGSVYINISKSDFEKYKVLIPNDPCLNEFHVRNKCIFEEIQSNSIENEKLTQIKEILLSNLF